MNFIHIPGEHAKFQAKHLRMITGPNAKGFYKIDAGSVNCYKWNFGIRLVMTAMASCLPKKSFI